MRAVDDQGEMLGVMLTEKALEIARSKKLDLVQVAADADPPVCRMMDYGKYKYRQKKRTQKSRPHQHLSHIKEIRLRMKICEHDLEIKVRRAREFLQKGDKVLVNLLMRGREVVHQDMGRDMLLEFGRRLEDLAKVEQQPRTEGRRMSMTLVSK